MVNDIHRSQLLATAVERSPARLFCQGDAETSCGIIPIVRYNGNRYAIALENCASRLMIQRIKTSGSKTCPSCGNG